MLVTSHLSRFFAPLAIAAISIALSSTAIAQCSGPSCGKPAGLGYAPIAIAPVATYNSGWTNSYASGPVFISMPAAPAPIQAGIANSIPVQSFQPAPQPIQAVSLTYAQPIAVQTAPAYLGPSFARAVARPGQFSRSRSLPQHSPNRLRFKLYPFLIRPLQFHCLLLNRHGIRLNRNRDVLTEHAHYDNSMIFVVKIDVQRY